MRLSEEERRGQVCQWFTPQEDPRDDQAAMCGQPAEHRAKVLGGVTKALVYLCEDHMTQVSAAFAARRVTRRSSKRDEGPPDSIPDNAVRFQ